MVCGGMFCVMIAMILEHIERNLERFTPKGCLIAREHKPVEVPYRVWRPWLKRDRGGGYGGDGGVEGEYD